jgi:hypothetical protein
MSRLQVSSLFLSSLRICDPRCKAILQVLCIERAELVVKRVLKFQNQLDQFWSSFASESRTITQELGESTYRRLLELELV